MEAILDNDKPAPRLVDLKEIPNAEKLKDEILEEYKNIVEKAKLVHGDLSGFNILYLPSSEDFRIIDWPQAVPLDFKEAKQLYERDIKNIEKFFEKFKDQ
jgi:RIO kinase 1